MIPCHHTTHQWFMFQEEWQNSQKQKQVDNNLLPFHQLQRDFPQTQQSSFCDFSLVCVLTPTERKENSISNELNLYLLSVSARKFYLRAKVAPEDLF